LTKNAFNYMPLLRAQVIDLNRKFIFVMFASVVPILAMVGYTLTQTQQTEPILLSSSDPEPFYLGVTYCGESVSEAKQLIDKVKSYTNLLVIQSGPLQWQPEKMNQICDYAVDSGLFFIVHFGSQYSNFRNDWFETFDHRWDNHFIGVYSVMNQLENCLMVL